MRLAGIVPCECCHAVDWTEDVASENATHALGVYYHLDLLCTELQHSSPADEDLFTWQQMRDEARELFLAEIAGHQFHFERYAEQFSLQMRTARTAPHRHLLRALNTEGELPEPNELREQLNELEEREATRLFLLVAAAYRATHQARPYQIYAAQSGGKEVVHVIRAESLEVAWNYASGHLVELAAPQCSQWVIEGLLTHERQARCLEFVHRFLPKPLPASHGGVSEQICPPNNLAGAPAPASLDELP